jgi:hypothetical protein
MDTPVLTTELITKLGTESVVDIAMFVFNDCDTFTTIYDFLV